MMVTTEATEPGLPGYLECCEWPNFLISLWIFIKFAAKRPEFFTDPTKIYLFIDLFIYLHIFLFCLSFIPATIQLFSGKESTGPDSAHVPLLR